MLETPLILLGLGYLVKLDAAYFHPLAAPRLESFEHTAEGPLAVLALSVLHEQWL